MTEFAFVIEKFESIGNDLRPCKGGGYQNVELRDSGQPTS